MTPYKKRGIVMPINLYVYAHDLQATISNETTFLQGFLVDLMNNFLVTTCIVIYFMYSNPAVIVLCVV